MDCVIFSKMIQHFSYPCKVCLFPKHIKLADPNFNVLTSLNISIRAEFFWKLICASQIKQSKTQPTQKTHFGWIIFGITASDITRPVFKFNHFHLIFNELC